MRYRPLGRTALQVSEICLGTMNFGPETEPRDAHSILDRALDGGVNFIDTADQYGGSLGVGATETIVGDWLHGDATRRDLAVLATKVYEPMSDAPNDRGLSARHIMRGCEASLRRLRTDHIDLYQMHHLDRTAPWDEIWQAMETLVAHGKILYVGSSNFAGWSIAQANEAARTRHFLGLVSEQSLYNLVERSIELEVMPACAAYGVGVLPWSPLAGGLLAGRGDEGGSRRRSGAMQARFAAHAEQLDRWESLCHELGHPPGEVALAWLRHRDGITASIVGPRTIEQLDAALRSLEIDLDDDVMQLVDDIFPGPGRAPEAYAW